MGDVKRMSCQSQHLFVNEKQGESIIMYTIAVNNNRSFRVTEAGVIRNGWLLDPLDRMVFGRECLTSGPRYFHVIRNQTRKYAVFSF
jgi:hypothetical protein